MKLILRPKPTSVYSEVEVATPEGALLYSSDTEPLSAPRKSYFKDANDEILATITTVRMDDKNRAHHVVTSDGRVFDLVRKFRNPASTTESYIKVGSTGWQAITRRAWTSRFEIRSSGGDVLLQARQVTAERGDTYELDVKDEAHVDGLVLLALITRYVMHKDVPVSEG